jgi:hypothetical protein
MLFKRNKPGWVVKNLVKKGKNSRIKKKAAAIKTPKVLKPNMPVENLLILHKYLSADPPRKLWTKQIDKLLGIQTPAVRVEYTHQIMKTIPLFHGYSEAAQLWYWQRAVTVEQLEKALLYQRQRPKIFDAEAVAKLRSRINDIIRADGNKQTSKDGRPKSHKKIRIDR